jgi:DNA-binding CsgD family transcriptional regulator
MVSLFFPFFFVTLHAEMEMHLMGRPKMVVVSSNTLALIGLRQLLQRVMPMVEVDTLSSFAELTANQPEQYFHFFVSMEIVLSERSFFMERRRKTIVLTTTQQETTQLVDFHCLYINQSEQQLLHTLLQLEQHGHSDGRNLPPDMKAERERQVLTRREIEVMSLIVQGFINKEVADKLHIGLSTVVTHRKNIMEKLGLKSLSALTIYAVTHGYVDVDKV